MRNYHLKPRRLGVFVGMVLTLSLPAVGNAADVAQEGTFAGHWSLKGNVHQVEGENGEELTLFRVEGSLDITSSGGLETEFETFCVGVNNADTGGVGRCAWTDKHGDRILIDLSGGSLMRGGSVRESRGMVIGGTGRYAGIEGDVRIDWIFVESVLDHSKFKGYVTKLEGDWKRP